MLCANSYDRNDRHPKGCGYKNQARLPGLEYSKSAQAGFTLSGQGMLVVIDPRVADYQFLAAGILPGAETIVLEPNRDAIAQITMALARHREHRAFSLHIVCHGEPGKLYLGKTCLSAKNLAPYRQQLLEWGVGEILLYSCEVAAGKVGTAFVEQLSRLTGADIAASPRRVGNGALGGSWHLESYCGEVSSGLAFVPDVVRKYSGVFTIKFSTRNTYLVNEADGTFVGDPITIERTDDSEEVTVEVVFGTPFDTATGGVDYDNATQTVTFPEGVTSVTVPVEIYEDTDEEGTEAFGITLRNASGSEEIDPIDFSNVNILEGDSDSSIPDIPDIDLSSFNLVGFTLANYQVNEDGTAVGVPVTIERAGFTNLASSIDVQLSDGTATGGQDFDSTTIPISFAAGDTTATVTVPIIDDTDIEDTENLTLELVNGSSGTVLGLQNTTTLEILVDETDNASSSNSSVYQIGNEFQVNSYIDRDQESSSVTALNDGGFVVIWQSDGQDGSNDGIYGQRYDSDSNPVGDEFQVNTYTSNFQRAPSVTALNDGGFVVAWLSNGQDGNLSGIYGQRYDSDGNPAGDEFQINTYTNSEQWLPSVTTLNDGSLVVIWQSNGQDGGSWGIYGQRYDSDGSLIGDEFQVNTYTENNQSRPSVTALDDGGFVVTWQSNGQDGSSNGIYGQRYDSDGDPVGDEFQVNTYTDSGQWSPSVTALNDGEFVVTWASNGQDGSRDGIYGQRYDGDGDPVGDEFQVNTHTDSDQEYPSVATLNGGGFVVTWESKDQDGNREGIYGQRYDSSGNPAGEEFQVNTYTEGNQSFPSVTALTNGGFVVTWESFGQDGSRDGIYGQRFGFGSPPSDISLSNFSVEENQPVGTEIGIFSATDPDTGDTHTYSLVAGVGDTDNESFEIVGNALKAKESFDYETKDSYSLRVQTSDGNGGTYEKQFNMTVTDANDPPVKEMHLAGMTLRADENGEITLFDVFSDPDGDSLTYCATLTVDNNGDGELDDLPDWLEFDYNSSDNSITFTIDQGGFPQDGFPTFWVELTAKDGNGGTASQRFRIFYDETYGIFIDGYIAGATVFFDANKNGLLDENEPFTGTDVSGVYQLEIPDEFDINNNGEFDPEEGHIVGIGGVDTAHGLPLSTPFSTTPGSNVLTSLTSLVTDLLDRGFTKEEANEKVTDAFSLPNSIDISSLDPIAAVDNDHPDGVDVLAAMVKTQNFITQAASLISGASTASQATIVKEVLAAITSQIQSDDPLDLTDSDQLEAIIIDAANELGVDVSSIVGLAADVMAEANQRIDDIVSATTDAASIHEQIAQVQKVALGKTADDLQEAAAGTKTIDDVIDENTGSALDDLIAVAKVYSEAPTDIDLSNNSVEESQPVDTEVGTFSTIDPNTGETHTYALVPGDGGTDNDKFEIVDNALKLKESLDYEVKESYSIRVQASDGNGGVYQEIFTINAVNVYEGHIYKIGEEFQFKKEADGRSYIRSVNPLSNDGFLVTWTSYGSSWNTYNSYAQVFDSNGNPVGDEFQVNSSTDGRSYIQSVIPLDDSQFVLTWISYSSDWRTSNNYAQVFDSNGDKVGDEFQVNSSTGGRSYIRSALPLDGGNFVLTWTSYGSSWSTSNNYAQVFDSNGAKLGDEFQANSSTDGRSYIQSAIPLDGGNFVLTWTSYSSDWSTSNNYAQVFDSNGDKVGAEFQANSSTGGRSYIQSVKTLDDDKFVLTWISYSSDWSTSNSYAQVFDSNGDKVGAEFELNSLTDGWSYIHSVKTLADGGFALIWQSWSWGSSGSYAQIFNSDGSKRGEEFQVNPVTDDYSYIRSVVALDDDGFVVIGQSYGQNWNSSSVYGQRFDKNGNQVGQQFQISDTDARSYSQSTIELANNDGFFTSWQSYAQNWSLYSGYGQSYGVDYSNTPPAVQADKALLLKFDVPTPLNITTPTDADGDTLIITVDTIPDASEGEVQRSNGTAVAEGDTLTGAELTSLVFVHTSDATGQAGTFSYTVSDGTESTTQTITLNNKPPVLTRRRGEWVTGSQNDLEIPANDLFIDPEDEVLAYSATLSDGSALPEWLEFDFDGDFFVFSTDQQGYSETVSILLTATDPWGESTSVTLTITANDMGLAAGFAIDGYIAGATVFFDANKNGVLDENEPFTATDVSGAYQLEIPLDEFDTNDNGKFDPEEGHVVAIDGVDTAHGLSLETPLTSTPDATVTSLLTSLVADLVDQGLSVEVANSRVTTALSLPGAIDLNHMDPIAATNDNEPGGVETFTAMVQLQNFITQTMGLISGASDASNAEIVQEIIAAITSRILTGATLDLTNADQLEEIIGGAASQTNVDVSEVVTPVAQVMAETNQRIKDMALTTPSGSIADEFAKAQRVALGETTSDFKELMEGTKTIEDVITENTGDGLDSQITNAQVGSAAPTDIELSGTLSVTENLPAGTEVGTLSTIDPDAGETHTYSLVGGDDDTDNSAFEIVDDILKTKESFDYETQDAYTIRVQTSDGFGGVYQEEFTIDVGDQIEITGGTGGSRDILTGTDGDDIITGLQGRDILTGGAGSDQFVYTSLRDAGDTITDFEVGSDKIVLDQVLDSLGYDGSDPITDGYISFGSSGEDTIIRIDADGISGPGRARTFILVQGVSVDDLNNPNNFAW